MASKSQQLHFILFPFMAQGHMIPMMEIAKLLAQNGVLVTLITTPLNANRLKQTLDRALKSGIPIKFVEVKFPAEEAGLPKDCENLDMLTSLESGKDFFFATNNLKDPVEKLIQDMIPKPNCMISDMNLYYTSQVAIKFQIPRIGFNGFCCFCMLCMERIYSSDSEYFSVPGLSHPVHITKQQLPVATLRDMASFNEEVIEAEKVTYGIIMNTFEELESVFVKEYRKISGKVWCIGPVSLNNSDLIEQPDECLKWLDEQQSGSVIYACFGSLCNLVTLQLIELALGLEASNRPFLWVIRGGGKSIGLEKWMEEEGFEERTKGRSFIIRGWAPQLAILSHVGIGGFLTHCGWNSTLEAISAGVPMITWPLFADQFSNEKLVVEMLKIGVKVGVEVMLAWGEEEEIGVVVKKEDVRKAILKLMDVGEEGEERRRRAKEFSVKAKIAVEENGSSYLNLKLLIEDIRMLVVSKTLP
ncbi:UDP-glycosyltransferase 73C6-like [Euphorbia lathyris]|uniref:UDP-glycosyltransferase 73C6-like n=1 Tax=Euphorbia lathyris TaxID=212925 RepID=UPI0033144838